MLYFILFYDEEIKTRICKQCWKEMEHGNENNRRKILILRKKVHVTFSGSWQCQFDMELSTPNMEMIGLRSTVYYQTLLYFQYEYWVHGTTVA